MADIPGLTKEQAEEALGTTKILLLLGGGVLLFGGLYAGMAALTGERRPLGGMR